MAFNLNKNEAADSSKKFDLSKTEPPVTEIPQQQEGRSKTGIFALLGLLVIGAGTWFFLSRSTSGSDNKNEATAVAAVMPDSSDPASVVQKDVIAGDTVGQAPANNMMNADTYATTGGNTAADPGKNNDDAAPASAAVFNNRIPATFAKGSTSISNPDQQLVNELIMFLQKNSAAIIHVNGYASSEGELSINQAISRSRADAFKRYLVSKGIPVNRIYSTGKGIDNPISSNDTEEGRMKNRRIEISIQ